MGWGESRPRSGGSCERWNSDPAINAPRHAASQCDCSRADALSLPRSLALSALFVSLLSQTNPAEILATGASPNVTQHGPYTYRQIKLKWNFTYTSDYDNRELIEFREWTRYEFAPQLSGPGLDPLKDKYTTFNLPFQAVASVMQTNNILGIGFVLSINASCPGQYMWDEQRLFERDATVDQVLFGYESCITQLIPEDGLGVKGRFPGLLGPNLPANSSLEALAAKVKADQVYTGANEPDYARSYYSWKGQTSLAVQVRMADPAPSGVWGSAEANRVYGTSGDSFQRGLKAGSTVVAWVDDLSRHAPLLNAPGADQRVSAHGIDLLRYTLDPKILLNASAVPANRDYYFGAINGLLNVSASKSSLPIFMSKPHFLDADAALVDDIIGMHPDRALHDTFLDVEALSGMTLRAHKRLQINLRTAPVAFTMPDFKPATWYPRVGVHYVPVAFVDQHAEITSAKARQFRASVYGAQDAIKYLRLLGAIFGAVVVAVALQLLLIAAGRKQREVEDARHNINVYA